MAYQSLYRRYRPRTFGEVRAQDHLVTALRNAVRDDRVGHAYLFSGPRGTGKTTTARILAKALNCANLVDGEPCATCESCLAIDAGTSFDVHELDAASNNGVNEVRDLISKIALGTPGRTKVYILDEVHMLTAGASNALLKTLEEPPDHVVFVLATTDPQKVLPTIRSRTQHYEVHLFPADELRAQVEYVIADAGLTVDADAIEHVVRAAKGSSRDALSALEQVAAAGGVDDDTEAVDELVEALCETDTGRALIAIDQAISSGRSPRLLGELLIGRLRDVFLAAMRADLSRLTAEDQERVTDQARRLGAGAVTRAIETLGEAFVGINDAPDPRLPLEVALVRLTRPDTDTSLAGLLARIERLERGIVATGSGPGAPAPAPAPAAATDDSEAEADAPARPGPPPRPGPGTKTGTRASSGSDPSPGPASAAPVAHDAGEAGPVADDDAPDPTPSEAPPGASGAGSGPAAQARQALSSSRGEGGPPPRPAPAHARPASKAPPRRSAPGAAAAPSSVDGDAAAPATEPSPSSAPDHPGSSDARSPDVTTAPAASAAAGPPPGRTELAAAWELLLPDLPVKARSRFSAGAWAESTADRIVFALPNARSLERCGDAKDIVESAMSTRFGRPLRIELVLDADAAPPPPRSGGAPDASPTDAGPDDGEDDPASFDPNELVDAHDVASSSIDRITSVFAGAELVVDD